MSTRKTTAMSRTSRTRRTKSRSEPGGRRAIRTSLDRRVDVHFVAVELPAHEALAGSQLLERPADPQQRAAVAAQRGPDKPRVAGRQLERVHGAPPPAEARAAEIPLVVDQRPARPRPLGDGRPGERRRRSRPGRSPRDVAGGDLPEIAADLLDERPQLSGSSTCRAPMRMKPGCASSAPARSPLSSRARVSPPPPGRPLRTIALGDRHVRALASRLPPPDRSGPKGLDELLAGLLPPGAAALFGERGSQKALEGRRIRGGANGERRNERIDPRDGQDRVGAVAPVPQRRKQGERRGIEAGAAPGRVQVQRRSDSSGVAPAESRGAGRSAKNSASTGAAARASPGRCSAIRAAARSVAAA